MKMILRIAKVELQNLFYSPIAWFILTIFTFQASMAFNDVFGMQVQYQNLKYPLHSLTAGTLAGYWGLFPAMLKYLYFYIPLATMGVMSRELGSGSIKLLYSSPVTNRQIILGKYVAMMVFCLVLVAILGIFVGYDFFTIKDFGGQMALTGLLGIFLLSCAYAAIGLFMSSLTSYQVVAAIGTLAMLAVLNLMKTVWQDIELVRDITYWLAINGRAEEFVGGLICSEDLLYFIIVIALFLALSIVRLNAVRQKTAASIVWSRYIGVLFVAMGLGYITSLPKMKVFYDATETKTRTLTKNSQDIVDKMDGGLTITTYVNILDAEYYAGLPSGVKTDMDRFKQYTRFKPEIKMKYEYYYTHTDNENLDRRFPELNDWQRVVELSKYAKVDSMMFQTPEEMKAKIDLASEGFHFVRELVRDNGKRTFLRIYDDPSRFPFEPEISAAFKRLVDDLPVVAFLKGHGTRDCVHIGDRNYHRFIADKAYRYSLINNGFDVIEVSLEQKIPDEVTILMLADVRTAFNVAEMEHLQEFIDRGGNLLIAGEPHFREVTNQITELLGIEVQNGVLAHSGELFQADLISSKPTREACDMAYQFATMCDRSFVVAMPGTSALEKVADKGFQTVPVLTVDSVWNEMETYDFANDSTFYHPNAGEVMKTYVTALALTRSVNGKEQRILVLGDADCLSNGELERNRRGIAAANSLLLNGVFYWMSDNGVPLDVRRPTPPDNELYVSDFGFTIAKNFFLWGIPSLLILSLLLIWLRRRGR